MEEKTKTRFKSFRLLKLIKSIFFLFILSIISITICITAVSAADYYFQIEIEHNFDENQEIVCDVIYDDNDRTWVIDEDSDSTDLILKKDFVETIEMDCNSDLDEINLEVYEEDTDERIFRERYDDTDGFSYELELVDKEEEWFSIKIDQNFNINEEITCELIIDNKEYEFDFNDDTSSSDFTIERNYKDEISFECDDDIEKMVFKVYDDDSDELYTKEYEDKYNFEFNIEDLEDEYQMKIQLEHDFNSDEISCDLDVKGKDDKTYTFDEDSSNSDLNINEFFIDEFSFDCDSDIDLIKLYIYDDNGDKLDEDEFKNEDNFDYELNKGEYEFFIQVTNEFNTDEEIECDLEIDLIKNENFDFDDSSSLGDLRIEGEFNKDFGFKCDKEIDSFKVLIFEIEDSSNEIDIQTYSNKDSFYYSILDDYLKVSEPQETTTTPTTPTTTQNNDNNENTQTPDTTSISNSTSGNVQNTNTNS